MCRLMIIIGGLMIGGAVLYSIPWATYAAHWMQSSIPAKVGSAGVALIYLGFTCALIKVPSGK